MGIIVAEGSELECAIYTHALIESFRLKFERDEKEKVHKEAELLNKFGDMTFEDLLKMERDGEE